MIYDYAVIGAGLIGSAAARYLSQQTDSRIVVIGPAEPETAWHHHSGVFASHYDQGRITRQLDVDPHWAELAIKSINAYADIESASGIRFYHECGSLQVGPTPATDDAYLARTRRTANHHQTPYNMHSAAEFKQIVPQLNFPNTHSVLHETGRAGYVNPRSLVAAQLKIAAHFGIDIVRQTAVSISENAAGVSVVTDKGASISAHRVLVAAGAWSQFLLGEELGLVPTPRTVVLAKLSDQEAQRLHNLPSIVYYDGVSSPYLNGVYALPPIRYPDGHTYLKIGGRLHDIEIPATSSDLIEWFHTAGNPLESQELTGELFDLVDGLQAEEIISRPCVITRTASGHPLIDTISAGKIAVAAGGCGSAAKSSNEIGRRAANYLIESL